MRNLVPGFLPMDEIAFAASINSDNWNCDTLSPSAATDFGFSIASFRISESVFSAMPANSYIWRLLFYTQKKRKKRNEMNKYLI